ncbi:NAD-dependent epimerase/dehydratase family protein [Luteimonas aquatica]|uniref:NAD-dependent epimerase/dehydratase family protein n=1 Tax=Luteimonas aquatica TaxID=450364 RepID=UPI001F5A8D36|nr:NAD-dependent epimerase/dehydratase family protein [Luteimonas aquatica]
MRQALVFGASGQIGRLLVRRLAGHGWQVLAVSRQARPDIEGVRWLRADLDAMDGWPPRVDALLSCGPLDLFARWYAQARLECPRVIAFGSTSVRVKAASADADERALAARLAAGERGVLETASSRGAAATVLRPTLIYGAGGDRTLTRIAALARRWHRFVLPRDAVGLRQPVHAEDLAAAAFAAIDAVVAHGRAYDLPGGESLPYREMVARVLAALQPPARLHVWPAWAFRALLASARAAGLAAGFGGAALARMREDLAFDAMPAQRDFGYAPRPFRPTAAMFAPPAE